MQTLVIEYLQETKDKFPEKTAIIDSGQGITFLELWRSSLPLACWINEKFNIINQPISLNLPKSIDAVIELLAIQMSGNIYVPLDFETPVKRKAKMLETLGSDWMIEYIAGQFSLAEKSFSRSDTTDMESSVLNKLSRRKSTDPLYIIFTSGTTGTPKGVTISNDSVIDYIDWAIETYSVTEAEVIGNQAPLFFDNSVLDLYLTFAKGCTLHLLDRDTLRFPADFGSYITTHKINFIFFVPSILTNLVALKIFKYYDLSCLKKILFAGEAMPLNTLRTLNSNLPSTLLSNLYGPTEITVDAIYWIFGDDIRTLEEVPLGKPCSNHRILFMDEQEKLVREKDKIAEICIAGPGVALGYWNDSEATRQAFISNPEKKDEIIYKSGDLGYQSSKDNLIYFTGRKDNQFKHNGYRIEAGEIESAMSLFVLQSCVLYDHSNKRILAFYTADKIKPLPAFRTLLSEILPQYMIPHSFHKLEQFPTTPNGKIDHQTLYEMTVGPKNAVDRN